MITEMIQAGVIFGHKKSKTHPRMRQYIGGIKNEIELIDPEATFKGLTTASEFLKEITKKGGIVLVVGTIPAAKASVEFFANSFSFPFVTNRWLGGTLTNYSAIRSRFKYFEDQKIKKEKGELSKYTKKEQQEFDKEIGKMTQSFSGLASLTRIPEAVLVIDPKAHETAVREANKLSIPLVAIIDTDDDPNPIQYPIFANDHNRQSIEWVLGKIAEELRSEIGKTAV